MGELRVLLVTQWYPPEPWAIYAQLAEGLARCGHDVTVATAFPNYPEGKIYDGYSVKWRSEESMNGVRVVRLPLFADHSRSAWRRVLNFASFGLSVGVLGRFALSKPDVIYAIQPPTAVLGAAALARAWRVPFVYDVQDMWPETLAATGMMSNSRAVRAAGWLCDVVHRRAAAIRVISPSFRMNLLEKGVPDRKLHVIPNWVDLEHYRPVPPDPEMAALLGTGDYFNIIYAGNVGRAQGLANVLNAGALLRDEPRIRFVIVGDGTDLASLREQAAERGLSNVHFAGRMPASDMARVYSVADVLLLHLRSDPVFGMAIPHKTLVYLAVGKPVIAAAAGDAARVVTDAGAGVACAPDSPAALAAAVRSIAALSPDDRLRMGECGVRAAREKFSQPVVVAKISRLLEEVVG